MKRFICLIFILIPSLCYAGPEIMRMAANHSQGATTESCTTGVTKVHCQNFETPTTGYDNGETWSQGSASGCTVNPASTSTPLRGAQSLLITSTGASECYTFPTAYLASAWSVFFRVKVTSLPSGASTVVQGYNQASTVIFKITVGSGGFWSITNGTVVVDTASTFAVGTAYNVWCDWTAGTGTNGTMYLYVAPVATTTKPGSPIASITSGNANSSVYSVSTDTLGNAITAEYDQWMDSTSVMGNVTP